MVDPGEPWYECETCREPCSETAETCPLCGGRVIEHFIDYAPPRPRR